MSSPPKTAQSQRKGSALSQTLVSKSKAPICPVQQKQQPVNKSINKSKQDGTFHRLSKPHQIKTTVVPQAAMYEKYSVKYFREHPEEDDDLRTAKEKLMDFDDAELEGNDKETFQKLIKQKTLRALEFGDDSKEVADSQIAIGKYYQRTERPQSAIRHYNEGKEIAQKTPLSANKCASIAVGIAESHFSQKNEGKKHISQAAAAMNQKYTVICPKEEGGEEEDAAKEETMEITANEAEIIEGSLHFRRDKIRAEIAYEQKDENACDLYVTAEQTMVDNDLETETEETADFYFKIASVLNENGRTEEIEKYARKAADLYRKLEKEEKAKAAEALIPIPAEEEEEEEKKNEEEQKKEEEKQASEEEEKGENSTRIGSIITDALNDAAKKKEENGESEEKKREAVTFADLPPQ